MTGNRIFHKLGVHNIAVADGFCDSAQELREELLQYRGWQSMTQSSPTQHNVSALGRQNGITTGHLLDDRRFLLPFCFEFRDYLQQHGAELARVAEVELTEFDVEMNAMAYGEGCWLSPHTDHSLGETDKPRAVAYMLYLTAPSDGEWSERQGGALRVFNGMGEEARVWPKFNRFALFRVSDESLHEIEKVSWATGWERCRIALSGWLRRLPAPQARGTLRYLRSPDYLRKRERMEAYLQGALASRRLLAAQRSFQQRETQKVDREIDELMLDYAAHLAAPGGTSFEGRISGPRGVIVVKNQADDVVYFGDRAGYASGDDRE